MREAIEDLLAAYAEAIDDGKLELWPGFFTGNGIYQIITRESLDAGLPIGILYCDSRGMMEDRVRALRTANIYEPHAYRHLLGRPRFERVGDGFDVRSNFCVYRIAQDGDTVVTLTAREVSGEERAHWWDLAVEAYPPYAEYQTKTSRLIPVFVLE